MSLVPEPLEISSSSNEGSTVSNIVGKSRTPRTHTHTHTESFNLEQKRPSVSIEREHFHYSSGGKNKMVVREMQGMDGETIKAMHEFPFRQKKTKLSKGIQVLPTFVNIGKQEESHI